ncbi:hypothetical protein [Xanthomonas axonopodis]|uniref:hypothetical protein n=1 Tax=Xanthomonas axonopodis TaxID=53413 RepID=UPI001C37B38F
MNEKSHVSLEQHAYLVCVSAFETGAILLDRRLRASLERHTGRGWALCHEHRKMADDGFVALMECDSERSAVAADTNRLKPEYAYRTGHVAYLRCELLANCQRYRHHGKTFLLNELGGAMMQSHERPGCCGTCLAAIFGHALRERFACRTAVHLSEARTTTRTFLSEVVMSFSAMLSNLDRMRAALTEWMIKEDILGDAFFINIEDWRARGEPYGTESLLILVFDGSALHTIS